MAFLSLSPFHPSGVDSSLLLLLVSQRSLSLSVILEWQQVPKPALCDRLVSCIIYCCCVRTAPRPLRPQECRTNDHRFIKAHL
jgi:hypothetical protein